MNLLGFTVCCFALFVTGSAFQDARNGEGVFGLPPMLSGALTVVAAVGWASWAWHAAGN